MLLLWVLKWICLWRDCYYVHVQRLYLVLSKERAIHELQFLLFARCRFVCDSVSYSVIYIYWWGIKSGIGELLFNVGSSIIAVSIVRLRWKWLLYNRIFEWRTTALDWNEELANLEKRVTSCILFSWAVIVLKCPGIGKHTVAYTVTMKCPVVVTKPVPWLIRGKIYY